VIAESRDTCELDADELALSREYWEGLLRWLELVDDDERGSSAAKE
jgi:hypothetical protein